MRTQTQQVKDQRITRDAIVTQDSWVDLFEQVCGVILGAILVYGASASANLF